MGSVDTVTIKEPGQMFESKNVSKLPKHQIGFISVCLWSLTAIIAVSNAETSGNVSGVSLTLKYQDVVTMLLSTFMMARGLSSTNPYLIYPWIFLSSRNIYKIQYPNVMKMLHVFQRSKTVSRLAYVAFGLHSLALVIKVLLILRIAQLTCIFWYQRKFQKEMV